MIHDPKFLAAIIADPSNTDLRLVYSDWLESNDTDDGQRTLYAELIRVQTKLTHLGECDRDFSNGLSCCCRFCLAGGVLLDRRAHEILHADAPGAWNPKVKQGWVWSGEALQQAGEKIRWEYRNGFPETISCPLYVWEWHGRAIVRETPVNLTITDKEPEIYTGPEKDWYWFNGDYGVWVHPAHTGHHLPNKIFKYLRPGNGSVDYRRYVSVEFAKADLVQACLKFAKEGDDDS